MQIYHIFTTEFLLAGSKLPHFSSKIKALFLQNTGNLPPQYTVKTLATIAIPTVIQQLSRLSLLAILEVLTAVMLNTRSVPKVMRVI